jgi:hypothetical protein
VLLALLLSSALSSIPLFINVAQARAIADANSPVIELEPLDESTADRSQVFTALVADDRQLKNVDLYHRRAGQQAFVRATMLPLGNSGYYSASIKTDPTDTRAIEYYLQARDESGNRTVSGYAFDPYRRMLVSPPMPINPAIASPPVARRDPQRTGAGTSNHTTRWWAVALGVLTVGALTSLANKDSSGGGGDSGDEPIGVPVTFNIQRP